jgi:hypothetical protein
MTTTTTTTDKIDTTTPTNAYVTTVDVQLARAYYPLLAEFAKQKKRVTYGELVAKAKAAYPGATVVKKAMVVSTGRRLDVVRRFTSERGMPDLTSLVVSPASGDSGSSRARSLEAEATPDTVFDFDWSAALTDFGGFIKQAEVVAKRRKTVKEPVALAAMSAHFREHQDTLPARVREQRLAIVEMIMEGFSAEEAFERALQMA